MLLKFRKISFACILSLFLFNFCSIHFAVAASASKLSSLKTLDLNSAAKIALADSPTLAAARERVVQAKQLLIQNRSYFFPSLNVNLSYYRSEDPDKISDPASELAQIAEEVGDGLNDVPPDFGNQVSGWDSVEDLLRNIVDETRGYNKVSTAYSSGVSATWIIFNGLEREFSYSATKQGVEMSKDSLANARRLLLGAVARVYLGALLAKENVAISKADEAFNKQLFDETKLLHEAGLRSLSDMLNFEISVNFAHTRSLRAQRQYESARYTLAALMGVKDAQLPSHLKLASMKIETDEMLTPPKINDVLDYAMTHRPDILAQAATIDISKYAVSMAKGKFYPQLYLNASFSGRRKDDFSFEGDDFGNSIGVFMTYNLFSGGRHRSKITESKSRLRENEKNMQNMINHAVASVRSAVTMVRSAQEQFSLQQTNAELAVKTRDLVKKEYMAGKASLTRLNEAQKNLTTIQGYFSQSRVALRQAWLDMEKESGKILERYPSID